MLRRHAVGLGRGIVAVHVLHGEDLVEQIEDARVLQLRPRHLRRRVREGGEGDRAERRRDRAPGTSRCAGSSSIAPRIASRSPVESRTPRREATTSSAFRPIDAKSSYASVSVATDEPWSRRANHSPSGDASPKARANGSHRAPRSSSVSFTSNTTTLGTHNPLHVARSAYPGTEPGITR